MQLSKLLGQYFSEEYKQPRLDLFSALNKAPQDKSERALQPLEDGSLLIDVAPANLLLRLTALANSQLLNINVALFRFCVTISKAIRRGEVSCLIAPNQQAPSGDVSSISVRGWIELEAEHFLEEGDAALGVPVRSTWRVFSGSLALRSPAFSGSAVN